jgi:hypothetical protein
MDNFNSLPFPVTVPWTTGGTGPNGTVLTSEQSRRYKANVNPVNGTMTVIDITEDGKNFEILNSEYDGGTKFNTIQLGALKYLPVSDEVKKSIIERVMAQATDQRADLLRNVPGNTTAPLKYVPGLFNTETPNKENSTTIQENINYQKEGPPPLTDAFEKGGGFGDSKNLYYPLNLNNADKSKDHSNQDYIEFSAIEYKPRIFEVKGLQRNERYKGFNQVELTRSTIKLPIQSGISDNNSVNWADESLDAIMQAASFASLSIQNGADISNFITNFAELAKDSKISSASAKFIQASLANMAISSNNNLFSRAFGSILNPNMELLFNSVNLRPFNFRFDLTPRSAEEATMVKKIIRVFKQSMAARQGVADIFLKTPMVYKIKYINGKRGSEHKSLNKIKTCALKNFNVNYTPSNQYMTYDDDEATMTAYSLEMQFQELEPVYFDDYDHSEFGTGKNVSIGY